MEEQLDTSVIVYMPFYDHPLPKIYNGTWEGYIGFEEKGENGFGYDPLFFYQISNVQPRNCQKSKKIRLVIVGKLYLYLKRTFWNKKV